METTGLQCDYCASAYNHVGSAKAAFAHHVQRLDYTGASHCKLRRKKEPGTASHPPGLSLRLRAGVADPLIMLLIRGPVQVMLILMLTDTCWEERLRHCPSIISARTR